MAFRRKFSKRTYKSFNRKTWKRAPWSSFRSQAKRRVRQPLHMAARSGSAGDTKTLCLVPIRPNEVMMPSWFKYRFISSTDYESERLTVQRITAFQMPASIFSNAQDGPWNLDNGGLGRLEADTGVDMDAGKDSGQTQQDIRETVQDPGKVDIVMSKIIQGYNYDDPELDDSDAGSSFNQLWKQPLLKRRQLMRQLGIKVLKNTVTPLSPVYNTSATKCRVGQERMFKLSSPLGKGKFYSSNVLNYIVFCFTNFDLGTQFEFGVQHISHPAHLLPRKMADARYDLFGGYGGNQVGNDSDEADALWPKLKTLYHRGDNVFDANQSSDVVGTGSLITRPRIATDLPVFTP